MTLDEFVSWGEGLPDGRRVDRVDYVQSILPPEEATRNGGEFVVLLVVDVQAFQKGELSRACRLGPGTLTLISFKQNCQSSRCCHLCLVHVPTKKSEPKT